MSKRDDKKRALTELFEAYLDMPGVRHSDCTHMADMALQIIDYVEAQPDHTATQGDATEQN